MDTHHLVLAIRQIPLSSASAWVSSSSRCRPGSRDHNGKRSQVGVCTRVGSAVLDYADTLFFGL